jgi:hypothetical protein
MLFLLVLHHPFAAKWAYAQTASVNDNQAAARQGAALLNFLTSTVPVIDDFAPSAASPPLSSPVNFGTPTSMQSAAQPVPPPTDDSSADQSSNDLGKRILIGAQVGAAPNAADVIGSFLTSGDPQARLDALQTVWALSLYVPLSEGEPIDTLMAGLFSGFDAARDARFSTSPTFPIELYDPCTGIGVIVGADLRVLIVDSDDQVVRDLMLYLNPEGQPAAEFCLPDGTLDRIAIDGYGVSISPDGQEWIGYTGDFMYIFDMNAEGELVYVDDAGATFTVRRFDTGG